MTRGDKVDNVRRISVQGRLNQDRQVETGSFSSPSRLSASSALSLLPASVHHQSSPVRVSLLSPLLLSHEIDGVRKEKERLTAIISPSDPWSVWLPSRSLSGSPAVPRLVGTLRASFLALRAPSGRMTRQAKDEGRSAEMTDGRRDTTSEGTTIGETKVDPEPRRYHC